MNFHCVAFYPLIFWHASQSQHNHGNFLPFNLFTSLARGDTCTLLHVFISDTISEAVNSFIIFESCNAKISLRVFSAIVPCTHTRSCPPNSQKRVFVADPSRHSFIFGFHSIPPKGSQACVFCGIRLMWHAGFLTIFLGVFAFWWDAVIRSIFPAGRNVTSLQWKATISM